MLKFMLLVGLFPFLAFATTSSVHYDVICEKSKSTIKCPNGQAIEVIAAFYGRKDKITCSAGPILTTNCEANGSLAIIKKVCDGHNFCVINSYNSVFGDPCNGTSKYVGMQYACHNRFDWLEATICDFDEQNIACPHGQAITVTSAFYGRMDSTTCPGPFMTTNCETNGTLSTIKEKCDGLNFCSVFANNSEFGDLCQHTTNYVKMKYSCSILPEGVKAAICEGDRQNFTCPFDQVINITSAFYGRMDSTTCPIKPLWTTNCKANGSLSTVRTMCNGRNFCSVYANSSVFGDPCQDTTKYVKIQYTCHTPSEGVRKIVCQHHWQAITCPFGQAIKVLSAFYGRNDSTTCPSNHINTTSCEANGSSLVIREKCNGYNSCSIFADNSIFGNPCEGTTKYLEMLYRCVRKPYWSPWMEVGECGVTCGGGEVEESRTCINGPGCEGNVSRISRCNTQPCPYWSLWMKTEECGVTCGGGEYEERRRCINGPGCEGNETRMIKCNTETCPSITSTVHSSVICETSKSIIKCPNGQAIEVITAFYGRKDKQTCPSNHIKITDCEANGSSLAIRAKCNGHNSCLIFADNSIFENPCEGTTKYVDMLYTCSTPDEGIKLTICEGSMQTVICPPGHVITVTSAFYGRNDKTTCPVNPILTTDCKANQSQSIIEAKCQDRNSCILRASSAEFDDPCVGTTKYLEMLYRCVRKPYWSPWIKVGECGVTCGGGEVEESRTCIYGPGCEGNVSRISRCNTQPCPFWSLWMKFEECGVTCGGGVYEERRRCINGPGCEGNETRMINCNTETCPLHSDVICERSKLTIKCPLGQAIEVVTAFYGRKDKHTCSAGPILITNCEANGSLAIIKKVCDGHNFCVINSHNWVFGDPCVGTSKYVGMQHACHNRFDGVEATICEFDEQNITCPHGQAITVTSAFYGRMDLTTCPGSFMTTNCKTNGTLSTIKAKCDGLNFCSVFASNSEFGDLCQHTTNYLKMKYSCSILPEGVKAAICEGDRQNITCPFGQVINITSGFYGRMDSTTCPVNPILTTDCKAKQSQSIIEAKCKDQNSCILRPTSAEFDDPCVGTTKYLEMIYRCVRKPFNMHSDVICERSKSTIKCPLGQAIEVVTAFYGRKDKQTCSAGPILTTNCEADGSLAIIKKVCDGHNFCVINSHNSVFGDPCNGTSKYVGMQYACHNRFDGVEATICEFDKQNIACPHGQAITVTSAFYGRMDSTTCPGSFMTTNCQTNGTLSTIKAKCDGLNFCSVFANNSEFGDLCQHTTNYLKMKYSCSILPEGVKAAICEGDRQTFTCPFGQVINVTSAFYGRMDSTTCPVNPILTTDCKAKQSQSIIEAKCKNRNSCILRATRAEFDDPCEGTTKYLEMIYRCVRKPSNRSWSFWGAWSPCGFGLTKKYRTRTRHCEGGSRVCPGASEDRGPCSSFTP